MNLHKVIFTLIVACGLAWSLQTAAYADENAGQEEMTQALQTFYAGQWDDSIKQFEEILAKDPKNTLALAFA